MKKGPTTIKIKHPPKINTKVDKKALRLKQSKKLTALEKRIRTV